MVKTFDSVCLCRLIRVYYVTNGQTDVQAERTFSMWFHACTRLRWQYRHFLPRDRNLARLHSAALAVGRWLGVCHVRVLCRNG